MHLLLCESGCIQLVYSIYYVSSACYSKFIRLMVAGSLVYNHSLIYIHPLPFRQAAMDITAKYCQKEMEAYGSCVASNPSTWQHTCHELKMKVAQCTSSQ